MTAAAAAAAASGIEDLVNRPRSQFLANKMYSSYRSQRICIDASNLILLLRVALHFADKASTVQNCILYSVEL